MPSAESILAGLTEISQDFWYVATFWHAAIAVALLAVILGWWRPTARALATSLVLPLASVSVFAWLHANPFNGAVFLLLGGALLVVAQRLPRQDTSRGPFWMTGAGFFMLMFGWVYPHFLYPEFPRYASLYAAPIGLVPCPTLSVVTGIALLAGGFGSRAWSLILAFVGLFYGVFGALRLHVEIDLVLTFGATALLIGALRWKRGPAGGVRNVPFGDAPGAVTATQRER
jgi:hypothetical protein